jgi:acetyl-CoA acetyltransferase
VKDLDVVELNEAFAAQAIPCMRELGLTMEQVNPNGGGISLGHPLGATGALLTTKILYDMQERDLTYGLVTMCIGGGQGSALVIKRER